MILKTSVAMFVAAMGDVEHSIYHLTRVQRAVVAAVALLMMGVAIGGFAVGQLNLPRRVEGLERVVRDTILPRQAEMEERDNDILEATQQIICDMNAVPSTVCAFWLTHGRPENLRTSDGPMDRSQ